jgi:hypothetical protein
MASHDVGDIRTVWAVFRNTAGTQTATTAALTYIKPGATTSLAATVLPAEAGDEAAAEAALEETLSGVTGVYKAALTLDTEGVWYYRWEGTGSVTEAGGGFFTVRRRRVPAV